MTDTPTPDPGLTEAWAEAEAALPDKAWLMEVMHAGAVAGDINPHTGYVVTSPEQRYVAVAQPAWYPLGEAADWAPNPVEYRAEGPTPAAALLALAARLTEDPR